MEYLKKYPVFNNTVMQNKIGKSRQYTKLFLYRLKKRGLIYQIEKDKYTVYPDAFLAATRIVWPSYLSCWSALKYHNLTEQIPHEIFVAATKSRKPINFKGTIINFIKLNARNFFGYEKVRYNNFDIFVADKEKAIIDSMLLRKVSFSEMHDIIRNNISDIRVNRMIAYLKKINNSSLIKRLGYLFETLGKDYYSNLKKYLDAVYIPLDYAKKAKGIKNKKWGLILNA